jgi:hypothetical protein
MESAAPNGQWRRERRNGRSALRPPRTLVQLFLKEYESLRDEIKISMQTRTQILTFGFAAETALIGAAGLSEIVSGGGSTDTRTIIILTCFAVPGLSLVILSLWLGEFVRMARAGVHVAWLETRIENELGQRPHDQSRIMTWEQSRWFAKGAITSRLFVDAYAPIGLCFGALIVLAPFAGKWLVHEPMGSYIWVPIVGLMLFLYMAWRFVTYARRASQQARQAHQPPEDVSDVMNAQQYPDVKSTKETV